MSRFRTAFVEEKFKLLCQWREQLTIASHEAWLEFLSLFSEGCSRYRRAVQCIATLDCLFSLAVVAKQPGFVRYDERSSCYSKNFILCMYLLSLFTIFLLLWLHSF